MTAISAQMNMLSHIVSGILSPVDGGDDKRHSLPLSANCCIGLCQPAQSICTYWNLILCVHPLCILNQIEGVGFCCFCNTKNFILLWKFLYELISLGYSDWKKKMIFHSFSAKYWLLKADQGKIWRTFSVTCLPSTSAPSVCLRPTSSAVTYIVAQSFMNLYWYFMSFHFY